MGNECKNVNIRFDNASRHDSVYIEAFWDDKKIFSDYFLQIKTFPEYSFNTSFGKHTLKLVVNEIVEEKEVFVFPIKYFAIDYYGRDFYEWESRDYSFVITEGLFPIAIE
jgi:hypothetical protein